MRQEKPALLQLARAACAIALGMIDVLEGICVVHPKLQRIEPLKI